MRKRMTRNPILFILITFVFTSWTQVSAAPRQTITAVFTVNSTLDIGDNNPGDGLCQTGPGGLFCSLRAAIEEANALPGHDTIQFNLGGSATMTFSPNPELPAITEPVTIDALTGVGTCPAGATPADLKVSINGAAATGNGASFNRGLLLAAGSDGSHIEGVVIGDFGSDPVVGGKGLQIESSDNIIRCNHIGVATDGTTPFGNDVGIELIGSRNVIGGNLARDRNVISGNDSQGIFVANGIGNEIYHNYIGTDAAGQPLGNGAEGILLTDGSETRMGDDGKGNVIAHNGRTGIFSSLTSLGPLVMGNSIHSNGDLGFDRITTASLFPGVTPNDSAHPFYFFPNLTGAFPGGIITGTFDNFVDAGKNFYVHFYSSSSCDGSGHGEGETYLGFTAFTTDNNGFFSFTVNLGIPLTPGDQITATASRLADDLSEFEGGTSEFSACITVTDTTYKIDTTTTLADSNPGDGVCDVIGPNTFCSLRAAIEEVNTQTGGPFLLQFDLGAGGGTIQPNTPLPTITAPVVLDGTIAQTGATCASTNTPARLLVVLDGSNLSSGSGLVLDTGSSSSTIQGLNIINFPDHGVEVNSNNNRLKCNYIGFESNSLGSAGNGSDGVYISGDNNELGGASLANQNVISGNGGSGVFIVASSDNKLKGNLIGLAKDGLSTLPNSGSGVRLNDGDNNQIGGTAAGNHSLACRTTCLLNFNLLI
ncbi:MAG: right-handed parallel beta-helix repeat-containing protein [Chloroflexota bacterium]